MDTHFQSSVFSAHFLIHFHSFRFPSTHPTTTIILYIYILYSPRCRPQWSSSICPAFMAQETCSSSSSSNQAWSYDVFVSFRGKDTGYKFTDHLFAALDRSGIHSFEDNRKLKRGKDIWTELEKAIQKSRIAVIVFSENYADSRWCLEELGKIMECKRNLQQIVLPVFYEVDPSHLRNQKGSLEKAFVSHEERFGVGKVDRWRAALTEAASLSGWDSQNPAHR